MGGKYAAETKVSTEQSRVELERVLTRYGASAFGYATQHGRAMVQFEANGRRVKFLIPLPSADDPKFTTYFHGGSRYAVRDRSEGGARAAYEQACRQVWRAVLLVVKAKLEAVSAGITTFEDEFLAHTVLADGRTFGEWTRDPQQAALLDAHKMPSMLPGGAR